MYGAVDPFAGACHAAEDICKLKSEDMCEITVVNGQQICRWIDRCETNECDSSDKCCGLSSTECKATRDCMLSGTCEMRQDTCDFM